MKTTSSQFDGKVSFCVGTGRCGTTLLSEIASREPDVAASHERERFGATFHMFCKWHGIAVDSAGFLNEKETAIRADLAEHDFSFESSALLSHSIAELESRFRPKFLLLVRNPADTVASFAVRGWFVRTPARDNPHLPPSFQGGEKSRHFLGRNIPQGDEFERWSRLTQIGRLAWFWQARNRAILEQLRHISPQRCRILRIEDLCFDRYQQIAPWMGWQSGIRETDFHALVQSRVNAGPHPPRCPSDWTALESAEFQIEVREIATALGYEFEGSKLSDSPDGAGHRVDDCDVASVLTQLFGSESAAGINE